MSINRMRTVIQHLRRASLPECDGAASDGQLLDAFLVNGDELALEALIRRHGPMVLGVCRRVLRDPHDAEDAFQATFLVLVRKGHSLRQRSLVGNWLYGVAYRCSLEIRSAKLRRRAYERQVFEMPDPACPLVSAFHDVRPILDRELERLPEKYRAVVVLCDLEGRKRREVAQELGLAEGTLSSRLATARRMLAQRLSRRGVTLSGGLLAALLGEQAQAAVPMAVTRATLEAATKLAAGHAVATLGISAQVAATFHAVLRGMFLSKLKLALVWLIAIGLIGAAIGTVLAGGTREPDPTVPAENPQDNDTDAAGAAFLREHLESRSWTIKGLDAEAGTITIKDQPPPDGIWRITLGNAKNRTKPPDQKGITLEGLRLAKNAKVLVNGREGKISDISLEMSVLVKVAQGKAEIAEIQGIAPAREDQYFVRSVDLKKNTVTLMHNDKTVQFPLAKDAKLITLWIPPGTDQVRTTEARMGPLPGGTPVRVQLGMEGDRLVVRSLRVSE